MMRKYQFMALAIFVSLVITVGFSLPAVAQVLLARGGTIEGETVTLGHLFDGLDSSQAATPIARAPAPGETATLTYRTLQRIAEANNIAWQPTSRLDRVRLERAGVAIDRDRVAMHVVAEIARQDLLADPLVTLAPLRGAPLLDPAVTPKLGVEGLRLDRGTGHFTATLAIAVGQDLSQRIAISGRALDQVSIPVAVRPLAAGHVITRDDLGWAKLRADRLPRGWVDSPNQLIGMEVAQTLQADQPIRTRQIARPVAITRGAVATLVLNRPPLLLTVKGRALEDGAMGETIRFENTASGRTVDAIVRGPDLAEVAQAADLAVAQRLAQANP